MSDSDPQLQPFIHGALDQNRRWLTAYFLSLTGDVEVAQDLVQEVFVRALRAAASYDSTSGSLGAWLRGIARHVIREHCRNTDRNPLAITDAMLAHLDAHAARVEADHADPDEQDRRLAMLHECLARLSGHVRRIFQMKYQQRRRSRQIAVALGMNENAVNVALCRGRQTLQQCIEQKVRQP